MTKSISELTSASVTVGIPFSSALMSSNFRKTLILYINPLINAKKIL
ncbi:hypothetical protein [Clostridium sp.]